jgi:hypothetical protein
MSQHDFNKQVIEILIELIRDREPQWLLNDMINKLNALNPEEIQNEDGQ